MQILQNTQSRAIAGVTFVPDSSLLIAGGSGGFDVWNLAAGRNMFLPSENDRHVFVCLCDPNGRWFYFSNSLGGCRLIDPTTGAVRQLPGDPYDKHVISLAVDSTGTRLVMSRGGAGSNRLECWRIDAEGQFSPGWAVRNGKLVPLLGRFTLEQYNGFVYAVAMDPTGCTLATIEQGGDERRITVMLWNATTGTQVAELRSPQLGFGDRLAITPDGKTLLGWGRRCIEIWNIASGEWTAEILKPSRAYFQALSIHPNGLVVVTVARDGYARYWALDTGKQMQAFKWPIGKLHSVTFSPDGLLAAAGGDSGKIIIWDVDL